MNNSERYGATAAFGAYAVSAIVIALQSSPASMWFVAAFGPVFVGIVCGAIVKDDRP